MNFVRRIEVVVLVVAVVVGCRSSTEPAHPVTIRVINTTCTPGPCVALRVLAFPDNQPATPGGFWSIELGVISTPSACLVIPASAQFRVTGPTDTTTFPWTTHDNVSLAGLLPDERPIMAGPSTAEFEPMSSRGWSVSLPDGDRAVPAEPCTP